MTFILPLISLFSKKVFITRLIKGFGIIYMFCVPIMSFKLHENFENAPKLLKLITLKIFLVKLR